MTTAKPCIWGQVELLAPAPHGFEALRVPIAELILGTQRLPVAFRRSRPV